MTDEITQTQLPIKKDKKLSASANTRGPKRQSSNSPNLRGGAPGARSASRGSNKKAPAPSAIESGSDTASRKGSESGKTQEHRVKNQTAGGRGPAHRKAQPSSQGARNLNDPGSEQSSSPVSPQNKESSDALSSLQRVIADLKTTSPVQQPIGTNNPPSMPTSHGQSTLASHAPAFQPGAAGYPGLGADQKHRKAVSLGVSNSGFNSFSPHLGAMIEDAEDTGPFEEGEIPERYYPQPGQHQPRSQSQSFLAPRFAALAAQQEQDAVGPTGRPQLAPGFMFGARKRSGPTLGPPINEEDVGFQFPQQGQQQSFTPEISQQGQTHKKSDSGEITGIMAEQVNFNLMNHSSLSKTYVRSLFRIR